MRVLGAPWANSSQIIGKRQLKLLESNAARHPECSQMTHIEHHRLGPACPMLCQRARRIRERHLPAAEGNQFGAQRSVPTLQRRGTHIDLPVRLGDAGTCPDMGQVAVFAGDIIESILAQQAVVVALAQDDDIYARVALPQTADFAVLAVDVFLAGSGDLHVSVELGKEEVGGERLGHLALIVAGEHKGPGLIAPLDAVEVEQFGELPLGVVGEHALARPPSGAGSGRRLTSV